MKGASAMRPVVLITHRLPKAGLEALFAACEVRYPEHAPAFSAEELLRMAPEADAVLAAGPLDAAFARAAGRLRVVSNYGAGYDGVDVAALTRAGVPLTNLRRETASPTAELAMTLLLMVSRRAAELDRRLRADAPERAFGMGLHMGHSLRGRALGILGMGEIGGLVRGLAQAFGMRVAYHNRAPLPEALAGGARWLPLGELLAHSDALTLHCPLTEQTRGLIDAAALARMKPGAVLINTARGAIVDHGALIDALAGGRLGGAGLDVFPEEPSVPDALRRMDNVVLTPHIGTNTIEARAEMCAKAAQNILDALAGRRPESLVNPEAYRNRADRGDAFALE
jgi:glyoxylate reductase